MSEANSYSLVADIGGTNTRVALASGARLITDSVMRYRNADHPDLETVLRSYLQTQGNVDCAGACVALAGPVEDGRGSLTNLNWQIDEQMLAKASKAEHIKLLNDLQAQGHALGHLSAGSVTTLIDAQPQSGAPKLVIGVGTGFNIAPVLDSPTGQIVPAAEAGHATLPLRSEFEQRFAARFDAAHGFPAIEDMLSGRGLEHVYNWLAAEAGVPEGKTAAEIVAGLKAGTDPICVQTAEVFVRMLGTVAGNLALTQLPYGGIYLAGGVARAFAPHVAQLGFTQAFRDKGRFAGLMERFAVYMIEDDYAALTGCACYLAGSTVTSAP